MKFERRKWALLYQGKTNNEILPFVITQYYSTAPNRKEILMIKWHLVQQQPLLREIFKEPPIISYRKGVHSDILVREKIITRRENRRYYEVV